MAVSLGQNIDSLAAQRELNQFTSSLAQSYERLSSGLRINQASDDAAGLAIVSQLNSHARVFTQAIRNVNDGVSAASIAEGALNALKTISQRQLELAEEAANGTYSTKQRGALNTEANALVNEYNRIVSTTTFNGLSLLDPSLGTVLIQAGYGQTGALQLQLSNQLERPVGDGTFATATSVAVGADYHKSIITADVNGDGKADIVTIDNFANTVDVLLGNGNGTFQAEQTFQTNAAGPTTLAFGDVNGDGKLDLVTADYSGNVSVLLGNGNGTFQTAKTYHTGGSETNSVALGDLNGDGTLDIVTSDASGDVSVFSGNGNGTFQSAKTYQTGMSDPDSIVIGDLNGDGKLDIVTSAYGPSNNSAAGSGVSVLLGNGNGTFGAAHTFSTSLWNVKTVAIGDFNGDGVLDLVTGDYNDNYALGEESIFIGNGNGTFQAAKSLQVAGANSASISIGDINGDGRLDFVTADESGDVGVFIGNGDGTFAAAQSFQTSSPASITLGDINGDGRLDVVTGTYDDSQVDVLMANGGFTSTAPYLNINTQQGARDAFNTVTANLNRVEAQLGAIGATTSRFQTELGNLQTETENFEAAAGRIQDTDVAQETANLTRTQILQQAATSVLAQANQEPSLALTLLGK